MASALFEKEASLYKENKSSLDQKLRIIIILARTTDSEIWSLIPKIDVISVLSKLIADPSLSHHEEKLMSFT